MPASIGGSQSAAFGAGVNHQVNPGKPNLRSITLGDAGLAADSARWDMEDKSAVTTPHSVLAPYSFSPHASSNGTAGTNFVPGYGSLGNANAESPATFGANFKVRMAGGGTILP